MLIPSQEVNRLIGTQGTFVKELSQRSNTKIRVLSDKHSERIYPETVVAVSGKSSSQEDAAQLIFEHLEKLKETSKRRSVSPKRNKIQVNITVPDRLVAQLIGREGQSVRNLRDMSGCGINFHKNYEGLKTPEGDDARLCTLWGSSNAISSAVRIILELIQKLERD